jgi:hypothetical protein
VFSVFSTLTKKSTHDQTDHTTTKEGRKSLLRLSIGVSRKLLFVVVVSVLAQERGKQVHRRERGRGLRLFLGSSETSWGVLLECSFLRASETRAKARGRASKTPLLAGFSTGAPRAEKRLLTHTTQNKKGKAKKKKPKQGRKREGPTREKGVAGVDEARLGLAV